MIVEFEPILYQKKNNKMAKNISLFILIGLPKCFHVLLRT